MEGAAHNIHKYTMNCGTQTSKQTNRNDHVVRADEDAADRQPQLARQGLLRLRGMHPHHQFVGAVHL